MCLETLSAWALYVIAAVTVFCGITIMGVGSALAAGISEYGDQVLSYLVGDNLDGDTYLSAVYIMIPVGTLLCVSAFFGCWGSWRRKQFWLMLFNIMAMVILVMVLVAGILASVYKGSLNEQGLQDSFLDQIDNQYGQSDQNDVTNAWDAMQNSLSCCGALDYKDWQDSNVQSEVPWSCCVKYDGVPQDPSYPDYGDCIDQFNQTSPDIDILHTEGCLIRFQDDVNTNADTIMGVCFSLGLLNLIGVGLGCFLKGKLEENASE